MKLANIVKPFFFVLFSFVLFIPIDAAEHRGRPYVIGNDIGFRWRTTLNVACENVCILCDNEHLSLRDTVAAAPEKFTEGEKSAPNVAAASLQLVFRDASVSRPIPVTANIYREGGIDGFAQNAKVRHFTTACPSISKGPRQIYPPITYDRDTFEISIPFLFNALGIDLRPVSNPTIPAPVVSQHFKYNYRDTEFQIVHELFSAKYKDQGKERNRLPRLVELLGACLTLDKIKDVALIILHVHTKYDPCAICAELLCQLSHILNYDPRKLLDPEKILNQAPGVKKYIQFLNTLCTALEQHKSKFLIEVSSELSYHNSRRAGYDRFYCEQLIINSRWFSHPILIYDNQLPPWDRVSSLLPFQYFPPFVVFKYFNNEHFIIPSRPPLNLVMSNSIVIDAPPEDETD